MFVFTCLIILNYGKACTCAKVFCEESGYFCAFAQYEYDSWACGILTADYCGSADGPGGCGCGTTDPHQCSACAASRATDECSVADLICLTNACPAETGHEGNICGIVMHDDYGYECCRPIWWVEYYNINSRWDPDDPGGMMCVKCDGPVQVKKIANTSQKCYYYNTWDTGWLEEACANDIDQTCEEACGAVHECDEEEWDGCPNQDHWCSIPPHSVSTAQSVAVVSLLGKVSQVRA